MKNTIDDLAIFGGMPTFSEPRHVGRPNIGNRARFIDRVHDMLDRRWLTNHGPYVDKFERYIAEQNGVKHCIAICNATVALEIATRALEMKGEVIIPSFTFVATAHALQWQEITPVFCDVKPGTHHIDPAQVERLITPRTTGIIGVHVWGQPCDIDALTEIAQRRKLRLLFDAAHAYACSYHGQPIGRFGDAEVFSFHATKFVNAFEGGAIVTNNDILANKIRFMQNFGFAGYDDVDYVGTNGKMTEVCAAMGLTSLESIQEFIEINRRNYASYRNELKDIPGISIYSYDGQEQRNYQYIILEIDQDLCSISRDHLVQVLHAEKVLARRYFYPGCHQMEPYRSYFPHAGLLLPNTEALVKRVLSLPTGTAVIQEDIKRICDLIRFSVSHGAEITAHLQEKSNSR